MEPFFIGLLIGFVLGAIVVGLLWNETLYDENDQKIKNK
jgi:gas vesicle protein